MSKNRIDLIPFNVYFRDGNFKTLKMGALANGGDIHKELVSMLRKSKIRPNDPLLQYFSICSVTGENGVEKLLLPNEHIWSVTQQFKDDDRLEFCRFIYPPSDEPSKKSRSSSQKKKVLDTNYSTSSDDNQTNSRKYVSDSETISKNKIRLHSPLSDQENDKGFLEKRSNSQEDNLAYQRSDPLEVWSDFTENNYIFSDCSIYKPDKEDVVRLFSMYIYIVLKQRKFKDKEAIKNIVQIALPARFHSLIKPSRLVDQVYLQCKEFFSEKKSEEDTMKTFNKLIRKSFKYYGVRLFYDCRIEDKKIISSNKQVIVGINEDGILILKRDGEVLSAYSLSHINDFNSSQNMFTVYIDKDKGQDNETIINIHTSQSVTMEYVLQAYVDRYVQYIFSKSEQLKDIKGSSPILQLPQYLKPPHPTLSHTENNNVNKSLSSSNEKIKLYKKKKKSKDNTERRRSSSMSSKRNIDVDLRKSSGDESERKRSD